MNNKSIFSLEGKTVLLTGASGHFGVAMSEILAENGAHLILASRNMQNNHLLKEKLKIYNNKTDVINLDLSDNQSIKTCVLRILEDHDKIDVLINNAYYGAGSEFHNMTEKQWAKGIDGSINSVFRLSQIVLDHMVERGYGKIVNVSSMYGIVAPDVSIYEGNEFYNPVNYGVGKAGIIQFTKYIAAVYGRHGITCNAISPGPFPSLSVQTNTEFIERLRKKVPLGRIGNPNELKGVIALLASDASSYINGANICIDGGWTVW